jgi:DNA helicase-2/ATP-dependent DNA helicase PcrA
MAKQGTNDQPKFLRVLNAQQRAAAEHMRGPLLVIAGAGTGKTKTLAARVANLIRQGADPSRILLLTFTRRAAQEMIRRAGQAVGEAAAASVWDGTFHAVAHRLLRTHSRGLGLGHFVVMDPGDAQDLLHLIRTDHGLHKSHVRFPQKGTLLAIYSRVVNTGDSLDRVLAGYFPWCAEHEDTLRQIFKEYGDRKATRNLVDYDDLLLFCEQALDTSSVGEVIGAHFQHVLVDEYQDTNPLQAAILHKLWTLMTATRCAGGQDSDVTARSIMVVGDDAQSIYSFRGATVENILRFPEQFVGATTVTLEQNYRSVTPILAASNALMELAQRRFTKNLWSERPGGQKPALITCADELVQSTYVADRILEHREEGVPLMRQAVLFRAGHNSDSLEVELSRRNIPFVKWGGLKFLEAAHIKDLLAFLRLLENPKDDLSWMRVLQLLDGVGPGRGRQAVRHLEQNQGSPQALLTWSAPASGRDQVAALARLLCQLADPAHDYPLPVQIERIRRFYTPLLEQRYENPEVRLRDLDQLELLAQRASGRTSFLSDLTLDPPASTSDLAGTPHLDEEHTVLSTIHSAKGCEWDVVYIIHAADGILPSDMAQGEAELEEERRLLYVAMTRARNRLYVIFPLRYFHRKQRLGDAYSTAQLSRFLPPELFPLFERNSSTNGELGVMPSAPGADTSAAVRARVRRMWD